MTLLKKMEATAISLMKAASEISLKIFEKRCYSLRARASLGLFGCSGFWGPG